MMLYLLGAFGLAYIVGHSVISLPFRTWLGGTPEKQLPSPGNFTNSTTPRPGHIEPAKPGALGAFGDFLCSLIECPACFGFWCGVAVGLLGMISLPPDWALNGGFFVRWIGWPIALGCITAGSNFGLSRLTRLI